VLLLTSEDFMTSGYWMGEEMTRAMHRHAAGETRVIPVILRPVDSRARPLADLQALPTDARAVTSWRNRDEAFANVAAGIRAAIEQKLRPPSGDAPLTEGAVKPILWTPQRRPPIRILHLSDLHFSQTDDPTIRLGPLLQDLQSTRDGLGVERLDYLVVSGDLTDRALPNEFEAVHQFLSQLIQGTKLSVERCIVVPGNHDLSWSDPPPYNFQYADAVKRQSIPAAHLVAKGDGYLVRDPIKYPERFQNFRKFHHQLTQHPYPAEAKRQFLVSLYETTGIQLLALNSAWEIDQEYRERSSIELTALSDALTEADQQVSASRSNSRLAEWPNVLRIAIWHHPITGNEKIEDDAFVEQLRKANFRLCLHGHVHETRADLIGYTHSNKMHVIGAGSFGAIAAHRPESMPRLYNLLEIDFDHSSVRVHTRRMAKTGGAWEGWAVWPSGSDKFSKRSYYDIDLTAHRRRPG
jgi:Icc-related predicted phosphoesterase